MSILLGSYVARVAIAVLVTAVASVGAVVTSVATAEPAAAATCSGSTGVSVVVDFGNLGGGLRQECAGDTSQIAAAAIEGAGLTITRVQRQPGFVCRIDGAPSSDPCVDTPPATAYWGLWWADGSSTSWVYSSLGVDSLRIPTGGSVALVWNQGEGRRPPGVAPVERAAAPSAPPVTTGPGKTRAPKARPDKKPSNEPTGRPSTQSRAPSRSASAPPTSSPSSPAAVPSIPSTRPTPSASPTPADTAQKPGRPKSSPTALATPQAEVASPVASPSPPATADQLETTGSPARAADDGLPTWVAPVLVVLLFGAAAGTAVLRRRRHA